MANVEINDLDPKATPEATDEFELQQTGGGLSFKSTIQGLVNFFATLFVSSVTGTSPVVSSGGKTPAISMPAATASSAGHATAAQIAKLDGIEAGATVGRELLTAARTYYINASTGNDSNDGLTTGTAFATIQKGVDSAYSVDTVIYDVLVSVADGTYPENVMCNGPLIGAGNLSIIGNIATPNNCVISGSANSLTASDGAVIVFRGFKLTTASSNSVYAVTGAQITFSALNFATTYHILVNVGSRIIIDGAYTISAGGVYHIRVVTGTFACNFVTVTITGTPNFTTAFALVENLSVLQVIGNTYTGSATGKRYDNNFNSVIISNGAVSTYLPGSIAGTSVTGAVTDFV